jgi:hypothetical protein
MISQVVTLVFLAVWHGWHVGTFVNLLLFFSIKILKCTGTLLWHPPVMAPIRKIPLPDLNAELLK